MLSLVAFLNQTLLGHKILVYLLIIFFTKLYYFICFRFFHQATICDIRVFGSRKQSECQDFVYNFISIWRVDWQVGPLHFASMFVIVLKPFIMTSYSSLSLSLSQPHFRTNVFIQEFMCERVEKKSIKAAKVVNNITLLKKICNADVLKSMAKMLARAIIFRIKQFCSF